MANSFGNPIRLDTPGATNLALAYALDVPTIVVESGAASGTVTLADLLGNTLFEVFAPMNATLSVTFPDRGLHLSNNGPTSPGWKLSALPAGAVVMLHH